MPADKGLFAHELGVIQRRWANRIVHSHGSSVQ
jgi:hypothetical protein